MDAQHTNLPENYREVGDLFGDFADTPGWSWIIWGNLIALIPLLAAIVLIWLPYRLYAALGAPLALLPDPMWDQGARVAFLIALLITTIPLHECLHALALFGLGHPARLRWSRGYFYATTSGFLTRRAYLIMSLTPLLTLTTLGVIAVVLLPVALGDPLVYTLLLNAAASVGDLLVAARVRRQPKHALFADRNGIKIFLP